MSNHAKVTVFYGICYSHDSEAAHKIRGGDCEVKGSPTWMYANACHDAHEGVELVQFGYYGLPGFALAVEGTVDEGEDWQPVEIGAIDDDVLWIELKEYCEKHGLPWSEPQWWAVPYYG